MSYVTVLLRNLVLIFIDDVKKQVVFLQFILLSLVKFYHISTSTFAVKTNQV